MTVYVVPCGVSLLDGLVAKKTRGPSDAKPSALVRGAADRGHDVRGRADDAVLAYWLEHATHAAADAKLVAWDPRVLCAESSTLAASSGFGRLRPLLDRDDTVLVLGSDTDTGIASALHLAQYVAGLDLADVSYASTAEQTTSASPDVVLNPGTLTMLRIRGLDPRHASGGFVDAVAGIGQALRAAFQVGEDLEVHLTGGFKATLLYTMAMTELLYSLAPDRVRACYLFEGEDAVLTEIGLRRFSDEECRDMRDELLAIGAGDQHGGARTFETIARDVKTGKLNAFGYGYLAVLGDIPPRGRPGPNG
ncbi:MAG TPA: hypothetical protein VFQ44_10715 [Streptosporangiaceae bacterium]|nr:hypothetical protein [Streptosporangiaceae bacterium]